MSNKKSILLLIIAVMIVVAAYFIFTTEAIPKAATEVTTSTTETGETKNLTAEEEAELTGGVSSDEVVGMLTAEAEAFANSKGAVFRVGVLDGVYLPVTADFITGRITAEVEDGIVVGYTVE